MKLRVGFLLFGLLAGLADPRQTSAQERSTLLKHAASLRCSFEAGNGFEWRGGEFMAEVKENEDSTVVFDRINREAGRARQIYRSRIHEVAVVEAEWRLPREGSSTYGLSFIEVADAEDFSAVVGGHWVSMTTVWAPADPPRDSFRYPAVFSTHLTLADPMPSQFPGWCHIGD